jgi:hypothetical protein
MNLISKKLFIALLFSLFAIGGMEAQSLKQQGTGADDIVPQGWSHSEAMGDLNKDGIADLAVMATPNFKEKMKIRDDGYEYNFNQPILAIYFGTAGGQLRLWKQYDEVLPANEDEFCSYDISMEITSRGVLNFSVQLWCSMGSYGTSTNRYSYRFQDGDFFLIGKEEESAQRNTGEVEVNSENYLTWKRQVRKSNFTKKAPPREKWSRLKKRALEKLGERMLE